MWRLFDPERSVVVVVVAILEKHVARRGTGAVLRFFLTDDYVVQSSEHMCGRRLHLPSFTQISLSERLRLQAWTLESVERRGPRR